MYSSVTRAPHNGVAGVGERERGGGGETDRKTDRDTEIDTQRQRETDRQTDRQTQTEKDGDRRRTRRKTERKKQRTRHRISTDRTLHSSVTKATHKEFTSI